MLVTMNTTSSVVAYVACFYWGFTVICRYTVLFVWASELCPPGFGSNSITALRVMVGTTLFSMNAYFMFASNSFEPIFKVAVIMTLVIFIVFFIYPESPRWLLSVGLEEEAIASFCTIAQLNKKEKPIIRKIKSPHLS